MVAEAAALEVAVSEAPGALAAVLCKTCKHAVCAECDTMLTKAGHNRCPMCRAPRPKRSTLPVQVLIHAFHCPDATCERPQCVDTKLVRQRARVRVRGTESRMTVGTSLCQKQLACL